MPGLRPKYEISLSENQVAELTRLSLSHTARYCDMQRGRIILLAHHHPELSHQEMASEVSCCLATVKQWRRQWKIESSLTSAPRKGSPRRFSSLQRTQIIA